MKSSNFKIPMKKKMKTIIIQDGTNNVLKHGKKSSQNFEEQKKLVDTCIEIFYPTVCVVYEIPHLKDAVQKNEKTN